MGGSPTFDRGSSEGAFQEQRASERDTTPFQATAPAFTGSQPGVFGQFPTAPGPMQPYTPDMTFSMPTTSAMPDVSGAGAAAPGATGGMSAGMSGLAGAGLGALFSTAPGLIGKAIGVDPETGMIINAASTAAAPAATAATAGALGVGSAGAAAGGGLAGAGAGLAAAAPALIAAAPIAAGMIMQGILAGRDTADAVHDMKQRLRGMSQLPGEMKRIDDAANLALSLSKNMSPQEALQQLKGFNTLQNNWQNNGWEALRKSGSTQVRGGSAGQDIEVDLPGVQSSLARLDPAWQSIDRGRIMSQDIAAKSGMSPEDIRAGADRFLNPIDFLSPAARERLFPTQDAQGNPWTDDVVDQQTMISRGTRPQSEGSYNATFAPGPKGNTPNYYPNMFAPLAEGQTPGVAPSGFSQTPWGLANEAEYNKLYNTFTGGGNQLMDTLQSYESEGGGKVPDWLTAPAGGAGAIPGSEAGGAGKRSPQFLTPELDNRAEAATGKLGGGRQQPADQGTPFGMGGAKRGGGMQVGAQQGGRPGGQAPFGGMARQTMMPQQGGGVQAQRRQPNGVV